MALARIPLPSFALVLTSDPHSFHGYPTAIKLDSPAMLPTAPDHLMKTIDLPGGPDDSTQNFINRPRIDYSRVPLETIFEEEEHSSSPAVEKQASRSTKPYVLMFLQSLRRKLFSAKNSSSVL